MKKIILAAAFAASFAAPAFAYDNSCTGGYDGNGNYYQSCGNGDGTYSHGGAYTDYSAHDSNCVNYNEDGTTRPCGQ
jgi:hypothetical protein